MTRRVALSLVADEQDQVMRLARFRASYPQAQIYPVRPGAWQAGITGPDGQTVITRYTLRELLDKLDELLGGAQ